MLLRTYLCRCYKTDPPIPIPRYHLYRSLYLPLPLSLYLHYPLPLFQKKRKEKKANPDKPLTGRLRKRRRQDPAQAVRPDERWRRVLVRLQLHDLRAQLQRQRHQDHLRQRLLPVRPRPLRVGPPRRAQLHVRGRAGWHRHLRESLRRLAVSGLG